MMALQGKPARATLLQTVKAVFSAFIGIRRSEDHRTATLSPVQVIVVGIVCAALFVTALIVVVRLVVS